MSMAVTHLLGEFEVEPAWTAYPVPVPAQIGGVARAEGDCLMRYQRRR